MANPRMVAESYLAAWNASEDHERAARIASWAEDAQYADPLMRGEGRDGIATMIATARTQFPGHSFTLAGTPDGHDDNVRFSWTLAQNGGAPVARGTDFVRLDREGHVSRLRAVYGRRRRHLSRKLETLQPRLTPLSSAYGMHVAAIVDRPESLARAAEACRQEGIQIHTLRRYALTAPTTEGIVLGIGAADETDIDGLVEVLNETL